MAILRARRDIGKDSEILTRYWHKEKDAWQNIFDCECCACTNHTGTTINPIVETAHTTAIEGPVLKVEYAPRQRPDIENPGHNPSQTHSAINNQDYPDSEMDDWDWDALEASPLKGTTTATQRPTALPPPTMNHEEEEGNDWQDDHSYHKMDTLNGEVLQHSTTAGITIIFCTTSIRAVRPSSAGSSQSTMLESMLELSKRAPTTNSIVCQ